MDRSVYYFILSDFSQIEMRILAFLSCDKQLLEAFMQPSLDFFDHLADQWSIRWLEIQIQSEKFVQYSYLFSVIGSEKRILIKRLCYGYIYGQGIERMARALKRTPSQTSELIQIFTKQYPGVAHFQAIVRSECRSKGGRIESLLTPLNILYRSSNQVWSKTFVSRYFILKFCHII